METYETRTEQLDSTIGGSGAAEVRQRCREHDTQLRAMTGEQKEAATQ